MIYHFNGLLDEEMGAKMKYNDKKQPNKTIMG